MWNESIAPAIRAGRRVLISAHGNGLRALIQHLDGVSERDDIVHLNIPTGQPLVYELDDDLRPIRHYYLGDAAEIEPRWLRWRLRARRRRTNAPPSGQLGRQRKLAC